MSTLSENQSPEQLIAELLATGTMNEDSVADLERMRADIAAGTLHPDDRDYLVAFHRRIMASPADEPAPDAEPDETETLRGQLEAALARATQAEAEVARLTALVETLQADKTSAE